MRSVLLSVILTRCKQRADLESDGHIADAEWQQLVSDSYAEMCMAVADTGMRYFETEETITATGATSYTIATGTLATLGVDYVQSSAGARRSLREIMIQERSGMLGRTGEAFYFAIVGQTIELYPAPASGTYKHFYIPQPTDISAVATSTSVDFITPDGEGFVIWATAVRALAKSESDVQLAMAEREAARNRLVDWARNRSFLTPRRASGPGGPLGGFDDIYDPWWSR